MLSKQTPICISQKELIAKNWSSRAATAFGPSCWSARLWLGCNNPPQIFERNKDATRAQAVEVIFRSRQTRVGPWGSANLGFNPNWAPRLTVPKLLEGSGQHRAYPNIAQRVRA